MFDEYMDYAINHMSLPELVNRIDDEEYAKASFDKYIDDFVNDVDDHSFETKSVPLNTEFHFEVFCNVAKSTVRSCINKMTVYEIDELQKEKPAVFAHADLANHKEWNAYCLSKKLLHDLSQKPEKILVKI